MREYEWHGKSRIYFDLKGSFERKYQSQISKYNDKIIEDVKSGNRSCTYSALRKLGVRPGDPQTNTFTLPSHEEKNLTAQQSAEIIADHFAAISQDYNPIDLDCFPPNIREELSHPNLSVVPRLEDYQVYEKICKAKKPNSTVTGDPPK